MSIDPARTPHRSGSDDSVPARRRPAPRTVVALMLALVLGLVGLLIPTTSAIAESVNGITVTLSSVGTSTYDSTKVLEEGSTYTLGIQYDLTEGAITAGETVAITLGGAVSLPDGDLAVPSGNTAIKSMTVTDGVLYITFNDPLPTTITTGVVAVQVTAESVESSEKTAITWAVGDSTAQDIDVIVKNAGDTFENVTDYRSKNAAWTDLAQYVSVVDGVVTVSSDILNKPITYTVNVNTTTAKNDFTITDAIDSFLTIDESSVSATLTTWDSDGLNKTTSSVSVDPTITATGMSLTTDLPADSQFVLTYTASITTQEALEALQSKLQAAYDKVSTDGGTYSYTFTNTASYSDNDASSSASLSLSKTAAAPAQPDTSAAFGKSVSPSTVNPVVTTDATTSGAGLASSVSVAYTLTADLTQWASYADTTYALSRNVVITDTLPSQASWSVDADGFLTVTDKDGTTLTFTAATGLSGDIATAIAADAYVGTYYVDGQTLYVNVGQDTTQSYTVVAKAGVDNLANTYPWTDSSSGNTYYSVSNSATFTYSDSASVTKSASVSLVDPAEDTGTKTDSSVFSKTLPSSMSSVTVDPGESVSLPYTFTVGAGKADVTKAVITDAVDTNVFDLSDLDAISAAITVNYNYYGDNKLGYWPVTTLDSSYWTLQLDDDGNLTFAFTDKFAEALAAISGAPTDGYLSVTITLPTKPIVGKQTLTITNKASLAGATDGETYTSSTSMKATTFGDEIEIQKTVYDPSTDSWTSNLRATLNSDGTLAEDEFIYRITVVPHGKVGSYGITIPVIDDVLPSGVEFVGWVDAANVASGTVTSGDSYVLAGDAHLVAVHSDTDGEDEVTISNQTGKTMDGSDPVSLYVKVKVTSFTAEVGITNVIGEVSATITPTNAYPLSLLKIDADDTSTSITDRSARFQVKDADGNVVVDNIYVVDGQLMVAGTDSGGNSVDKIVTVPSAGTYTVVEVTAPSGYEVSADETTVTVDADGNSPQTKLYDTRSTTTATPSASTSDTPTPSASTSDTPTATPSDTPSTSDTPTPSASTSDTPTPSTSDTPTATPSDTPSTSDTPTPSASTSDTPTPSTSDTPTATPSDTPTATPSTSDTPTATPNTATPTATPSTATPSPTALDGASGSSPTATPSATATASTTPSSSASPTATPSSDTLAFTGADGAVLSVITGFGLLLVSGGALLALRRRRS